MVVGGAQRAGDDSLDVPDRTPNGGRRDRFRGIRAEINLSRENNQGEPE